MAAPARLYLDTARLGLMSPSAQLAAGDFVRLAGEDAFTLYFDRFLSAGTKCWPDRWLSKFSGLAEWPGIAELKAELRAQVGVGSEFPVLLANRSAWLMQCAARLLFHKCDRVLVTDNDWPAYREILARERRRTSRDVAIVRIRDDILNGAIDEEEAVGRVCSTYHGQRCDGLFMTAVSNLGIRLPVRRIVQAIEECFPLCFVVVDGAQEFCHAATNLGDDYCDLYLTGCHKWLRAHQPMGIMFSGRKRSKSLVERRLGRWTRKAASSDPLLRFSQQVDEHEVDDFSETVNVAPLLSTFGALRDLPKNESERQSDFTSRIANALEVARIADGAGWRPLLPKEPFRSGILLLQAERPSVQQRPAQQLRELFHQRGIAITTYDTGLIRLSMPTRPLHTDDLDRLRDALIQTG
jgi:hypothetical protein